MRKGLVYFDRRFASRLELLGPRNMEIGPRDATPAADRIGVESGKAACDSPQYSHTHSPPVEFRTQPKAHVAFATDKPRRAISSSTRLWWSARADESLFFQLKPFRRETRVLTQARVNS